MDTATGLTTGFEDWEQRICRTFVPLRARCSDGASHFSGDVGSASMGSVVLADVCASHAVVERTPRLIRRDDPELYKFGLQVSGESVVEQDDRQAHLRPGDLAIYDTSRPYRISFADDFRMTVAMFPRSLVRLPEKHMAALTAVRLAGDTGLASLIAPLMRGLSAELNATRPVIATHLGDAVVDLVTAAFAQQMQLPLEADAPGTHRVLIAQVSKFIDDHLHDPELSTKTVADVHFVSVRLLQKVFMAEGTSVSTLIRTRRLERCRRDLADRHQQHLSIAHIGHRWGFPDPAYFSRLFRSTYGVAPREFRKSTQPDVDTTQSMTMLSRVS
ncbi:helix-turn-helix domain-containing protein [Mycobacterium sp.]|uniref:AraC-like ligand-binding domain-containing protein n=1 Tax=Mycobacterium sp. TaxID=1785 RepID=UPI002C2DEDF1|nr:helix-turn-helix domain-containing protein [Mycobacterium sp.]HKP42708.1 helix-turn-helix domain-containing protein [Mycobacterium sp.]